MRAGPLLILSCAVIACPAARQGSAADTALSHLGFRCVKDLQPTDTPPETP